MQDYCSESRLRPTIYNIKRGLWHALVRATSQLSLDSIAGVKSDETNTNQWNIGWVDKASLVFYRSLSRMQKINHLLGVEQLCRKRNLVRAVQAVNNLYPTEFDFIPKSWGLPRDRDELEKYMATKAEEARERGDGVIPTYIVKPGSSCQGRGIYLVQSFSDIEMVAGHVVQEYLDKPLTILGRKFDLRIYVLMTSAEPLRLYIYEDGLARFATKQYEQPTPENISGLFTHLTNYSLNKLNKEEFCDVGNDSNNSDNESFNPHNNKWSLLQFNDYIASTFGVERFDAMWSSINEIIIKTVILGLPVMNAAYNLMQSEGVTDNNINYANKCKGFQLYGFDIMLDDQWKPWLIEVNRNPSLRCESSVDEYIKTMILGQLIYITDPITSLRATPLFMAHMANILSTHFRNNPQLLAESNILPAFHKFCTMNLGQVVCTSSRLPDAIWEQACDDPLTRRIIKTFFDVERPLAMRFFSGELYNYWRETRDKIELQIRLEHEDRLCDSLHHVTAFYHSSEPPAVNDVKLLKLAHHNSYLTPAAPPLCTGSVYHTQFLPLLARSPLYKRNGFSRLISKKVVNQQTESYVISIPRDPISNLPIYASNFRGIYPLIPHSDYPYPYSQRVLEYFSSDGKRSKTTLYAPDVEYPLNLTALFSKHGAVLSKPPETSPDDTASPDDAASPDASPDITLKSEDINALAVDTKSAANAQPEDVNSSSADQTDAQSQGQGLVVKHSAASSSDNKLEEYKALTNEYHELIDKCKQAATSYLNAGVREAVLGKMGLAGYPTLNWTNSAIQDERSIRQMQQRNQAHQSITMEEMVNQELLLRNNASTHSRVMPARPGPGAKRPAANSPRPPQ